MNFLFKTIKEGLLKDSEAKEIWLNIDQLTKEKTKKRLWLITRWNIVSRDASRIQNKKFCFIDIHYNVFIRVGSRMWLPISSPSSRHLYHEFICFLPFGKERKATGQEPHLELGSLVGKVVRFVPLGPGATARRMILKVAVAAKIYTPGPQHSLPGFIECTVALFCSQSEYRLRLSRWFNLLNTLGNGRKMPGWLFSMQINDPTGWYFLLPEIEAPKLHRGFRQTKILS